LGDAVWLTARRGQLRDDPVVAVRRDPAAYLMGLVSVAIVRVALRSPADIFQELSDDRDRRCCGPGSRRGRAGC